MTSRSLINSWKESNKKNWKDDCPSREVDRWGYWNPIRRIESAMFSIILVDDPRATNPIRRIESLVLRWDTFFLHLHHESNKKNWKSSTPLPTPMGQLWVSESNKKNWKSASSATPPHPATRAESNKKNWKKYLFAVCSHSLFSLESNKKNWKRLSINFIISASTWSGNPIRRIESTAPSRHRQLCRTLSGIQ